MRGQSEPPHKNQHELSHEDPALDAESGLIDETVTHEKTALDYDSSLIDETVSYQCAPDSERFCQGQHTRK